MDTVTPSVSPMSLRESLGSAASPLLVDVRRPPAFAQDDRLAAGATWRDPFAVESWQAYLPRHRDVVVYCVHGHEVSHNACSALRALGVRASYLEGGIAAWREAGLPTVRKVAEPAIPSEPGRPSRWITRERPKVDRIACPWLIRRFIDPFAQFDYVPPDAVLTQARERAATPYDVPGVRFTHRGERCSFDALIGDFGLEDPALARLAAIVRGADTARPGLAPQSAGLVAISLGLSATIADDHRMLEHGLVLYDALHAWCRQEEAGRAERHAWTAPS